GAGAVGTGPGAGGETGETGPPASDPAVSPRRRSASVTVSPGASMARPPICPDDVGAVGGVNGAGRTTAYGSVKWVVGLLASGPISSSRSTDRAVSTSQRRSGFFSS